MPGTRTLLHRSDFLATARHGDKFVAASLIMQVRNRRDDEAPRLGLTATRKIGNAVTRNRARRRMRAAASLRLSPRARPGHDYVLIARHNTASRPWQGLVDDLDRLITDHEKQLQ